MRTFATKTPEAKPSPAERGALVPEHRQGTGQVRQEAVDSGPTTQVTVLLMSRSLQRDPSRSGIGDSTQAAPCPRPPSNRSGH